MNGIGDILGRINTYIVNPIMVVLVAAGFFVFMWGLVEFMWNLKDGKDMQKGKEHMTWGVAGLFIMVSVWGIIGLIVNTLGLNANDYNINNANSVDTGFHFDGGGVSQ